MYVFICVSVCEYVCSCHQLKRQVLTRQLWRPQEESWGVGGGWEVAKEVSACVCVYVCVWMCVRAGLASAHLLTDFYLSGQNRKRSLSFVIGAPPSVKPSILLSFSLIHVLYCAHHYRTVWITGFIPRPQSPNTLSGLQISYNEELLFLDKD